MKGLLRNSIYESLGGLRLITVFGIAAGIGLLATKSVTVLQLLTWILPLALALNSVGSIRKNASVGWDRYEIILPIRRKDITFCRYLIYFLWVVTGLIAAVCLIAPAVSIYGFGWFFERNWEDVGSLFSMGFGISILVGAVFQLTITLLGTERSEIIMLLSIAAGVIIFMAFIWVMHQPFFESMNYGLQLLIINAVSAVCYLISYPLAKMIYQKREF